MLKMEKETIKDINGVKGIWIDKDWNKETYSITKEGEEYLEKKLKETSLSKKEVITKVFVTEDRHTNYRVGYFMTEDVREAVLRLKKQLIELGKECTSMKKRRGFAVSCAWIDEIFGEKLT